MAMVAGLRSGGAAGVEVEVCDQEDVVSAVPGGVHEADDVAVTIAVEAQERSSADPTVIPFSERALPLPASPC